MSTLTSKSKDSLGPKSKVLLIEDEVHIAKGLAFNLDQEGLTTQIACDGEEGFSKWKSFQPNLIVLDLMLPKINGLEVLKLIRQQDERLPILILSAKSKVNDIVEGLALGADDYLAKPFHLEELILRVQRLLKHSEWYQHDTSNNNFYHFGMNKILFDEYMAHTQKGEFRLTEQEMRLLKIFITNPNRVLSKKEILGKGWGYSEEIETRTLDIFMTRLRKYFEKDHKKPQHFQVLRNKGIIFYPEAKIN